MTLGLIKQGLVQDEACANVGRLVRIDLGFPEILLKQFSEDQPRRICSNDLATLPWPKLAPAEMKYQRGRVLLIAGSDQYRGAALLALKGALASGVGSIEAFVPPKVAEYLWVVAPEVVLATEHSLDNSNNGYISIGNFLAGKDLSRLDALLLGPGLGIGCEPWKFFAEAIERFKGLLILDADGINSLAVSAEGWQWLKKRKGPTWITPHISEFQRLFPEINTCNRISAASQAAKSSGVVVLLKGAHSVISDPSGATWQLGETAPWVARAGLGDLLAGFAAGLGSIGLAASQKCEGQMLAMAAFVHAEAARRSSQGTTASSVEAVLKALVTTFQVDGSVKSETWNCCK